MSYSITVPLTFLFGAESLAGWWIDIEDVYSQYTETDHEFGPPPQTYAGYYDFYGLSGASDEQGWIVSSIASSEFSFSTPDLLWVPGFKFNWPGPSSLNNYAYNNGNFSVGVYQSPGALYGISWSPLFTSTYTLSPAVTSSVYLEPNNLFGQGFSVIVNPGNPQQATFSASAVGYSIINNPDLPVSHIEPCSIEWFSLTDYTVVDTIPEPGPTDIQVNAISGLGYNAFGFIYDPFGSFPDGNWVVGGTKTSLGTGETLPYTFPQPGTFLIGCRATDFYGRFSELWQWVTVKPNGGNKVGADYTADGALFTAVPLIIDNTPQVNIYRYQNGSASRELIHTIANAQGPGLHTHSGKNITVTTVDATSLDTTLIQSIDHGDTWGAL